MLNFLLPLEGDVVIVEGDVQAKLREESEALGIGRHRGETKLVLAPAITEAAALRMENLALEVPTGTVILVGLGAAKRSKQLLQDYGAARDKVTGAIAHLSLIADWATASSRCPQRNE